MLELTQEPETRRDARLVALRTAAVTCRREWRWQFGRFWLLRWENTLRRPGWRVDEEARAWRRMREEVRRYAELRRHIAELSRDLPIANPDRQS